MNASMTFAQKTTIITATAFMALACGAFASPTAAWADCDHEIKVTNCGQAEYSDSLDEVVYEKVLKKGQIFKIDGVYLKCSRFTVKSSNSNIASVTGYKVNNDRNKTGYVTVKAANIGTAYVKMDCGAEDFSKRLVRIKVLSSKDYKKWASGRRSFCVKGYAGKKALVRISGKKLIVKGAQYKANAYFGDWVKERSWTKKKLRSAKTRSYKLTKSTREYIFGSDGDEAIYAGRLLSDRYLPKTIKGWNEWATDFDVSYRIELKGNVVEKIYINGSFS